MHLPTYRKIPASTTSLLLAWVNVIFSAVEERSSVAQATLSYALKLPEAVYQFPFSASTGGILLAVDASTAAETNRVMEKHPPKEPIPVVDTPGDEPCAKIWSVYISEAERKDRDLADSWRSNANGVLIFAGLFSAILTAFIIENLQPEMDSLSLACIAQSAANATNSIPASVHPNVLPCAKFGKALAGSPTSGSSLACNILWFFSLGFSLTSALAATLVEQWARDFISRTERLSNPVKRARIFAYLYYGLRRFNMHRLVAAIPLLLHLSLLFFFAGLIVFLAPVNTTVAGVAAVPIAIILLLYGYMTVLPLLVLDCPCLTPLSRILWDIRSYFLRQLISYRMRCETKADRLYLLSMDEAMIEEATLRSDDRVERDKRALAWTMKSLADDDELEPFVEGIPDMIWGPDGRRRKYDDLIRGLLRDPQVLLGSRIQHLFSSCESGLLEPAVKARREVSCLKAIWYLGMMGEKGIDRDPSKTYDIMHPPPPDPVQPMNFLEGLRFPPLKTPAMTRYLPSITALADWNNLCSLYGHFKKLTASLNNREAQGRLSDIRVELEGFLAERRRCKWAYLVPISSQTLNLEKLSQELKALYDKHEPLTVQASFVWVDSVSQLIALSATSFNSVQYHVLLSFLQRCTDLDELPYEFDLTVQILQDGLNPVGIPIGLAVATFCDNVRKAVQIKSPSITHNDRVIGTVLPWIDKAYGMSTEMVERVSNAGMEYINNRYSNDAICRALRDSSITRMWERLTGRLETCRPDMLGDYSKAIWHLASLFPGLSTPDARLSEWPNFTPNTLSVAPAPSYSASVIALLKTHILNAFDDAYQTTVLSSHLQALETQITALDARIKAKENPSLGGCNVGIAKNRD
ncbi:hypothetical protein MSAN_01158300 [Mycena sanguinolenta]|uniref:DUF6535 domain-containing protein n=1 Tax=Mycena sanguinolenta TaxID=230812 RepID=A0A8H6YHI4_9AGAR|nr:hypothetical protein MSAN_01158300 [Mycena sanguinolenta]